MARERLRAPRTLSGQISRAKQHVPLNLLRNLVSAGKCSALWTTAFGMMAINEVISQRQYETGLKFARQRAAADRALGIRRVQAQNIDKAIGGNDTWETPDDIEAGARAIRRWENATSSIGGNTSACYKALEWIVLDLRQPDDYQQIIDLKRGLTMLLHHYASRGE